MFFTAVILYETIPNMKAKEFKKMYKYIHMRGDLSGYFCPYTHNKYMDKCVASAVTKASVRQFFSHQLSKL